MKVEEDPYQKAYVDENLTITLQLTSCHDNVFGRKSIMLQLMMHHNIIQLKKKTIIKQCYQHTHLHS